MSLYQLGHNAYSVRAKILKLLLLFFEINFPPDPKQIDDKEFHQEVKKSLEELQAKFGHRDYRLIEEQYIPRLNLKTIKKIFKWHT